MCNNVAIMYFARSLQHQGAPAGRLCAQIVVALSLLYPASGAFGQLVEATAVTAEIRAIQPFVLPGTPIWVQFTLYNPTDQVAVLYNKGAPALDLNAPEMGLPLAHVLGLEATAAVEVLDASSQLLGSLDTAPPPEHAIALRLAPQATVGLRVDVRRYNQLFEKPGRYKLRWRPYDGALVSNTIEVTVGSLKKARIHTDHGSMDLHFFYSDAPRHVENFIELAEDGFYDNLTFHRIIPNYLIQGGSPGQAVAGLRPDGVTLKAEFNDHPFMRGTVGMARNPQDPDSASCQFFICDTRWEELDGQYTAFAELSGAESFQTLSALMLQPVNENGQPLSALYIRKVEILDDSNATGSGSFSRN